MYTLQITEETVKIKKYYKKEKEIARKYNKQKA